MNRLFLLAIAWLCVDSVVVFGQQQPDELQNIQWNLGAHTATYGASGGITKPFISSSYTSAWDAGATSVQRIIRDGRIEFHAIPGSQCMIGLSLTSVNVSYQELDYAIYIVPSGSSTTSGTATIYQNGTAGASLGTFTATTTFAIRRIGNQVQYLMDGVVKNTSAVSSSGILLVDTSFYKQSSGAGACALSSAKIFTGDLDNDGMPDAWEESFLPPNHSWIDVVGFTADGDYDGDGVSNLQEFQDGSNPANALSFLSPVVWASPVGTLAQGADGGLLKTSTTVGWNSDAASNKTILKDGRVAFRVPTGSYLMVGLTPSNDNRTNTDLEYSIVVSNVGAVTAVRPESTTGLSLGTATAETLYAIQRTNGKIQYFRDGTLMYTSTTLSTGPLLVDCSLYSAGASIASTRLYTGDLDSDGMPDVWELSHLPDNSTYADLLAFTPGTSGEAGGDPDGDGICNLYEYYDDTNPMQALVAPATVVWTGNPSSSMQVTDASTGAIKKIAGGAGWNADAVSSKTIYHTGKLTFNISAAAAVEVGLTLNDDNRSYTDLEYAILTNAAGTCSVFENGTSKISMGSYNATTRFTIRRVGGSIEYIKDGVTYYTSTVPVAASLRVDSSFYTQGASITAARLYTGDLDEDLIPDDWEIYHLERYLGHAPSYADLHDTLTATGDLDGDGISNRDEYASGTDPLQQVIKPVPVTWTSLIGTQAVGTDGGLKKISGTTGIYNADAVGTQSLTGDGTLTFSAANTGVLAVGLTYANNSRADTDLEFAFVLTTTGSSVQRPESTTDLAVGTYTANTIFGIRRTGTLVEFIKDGAVVYTSTTASSSTLLVDCSIATLNHQITSARITTTDVDNDGLPDLWELAYLPLNATLAELQALTPSSDGPDNDGVSLLSEYQHGTSALLADTDGDGMSDAWEISHNLDATDPTNTTTDADSDGLSNLGEYFAGTNPEVPDTDGDGIPDGYEVQNGLNALNPSDSLADKDGDGVPNLWEYARGSLANNAASIPEWDAIVDPGFLIGPPGAKQFSTLYAAYESLPQDSSYRATILMTNRVPNSEYFDASSLSSGSVPLKVAIVGPAGVNRSTFVDGSVFSGWCVLNSETVFSRIIFDYGDGIVINPSSGSSPVVHFSNCIFRNVHPYRSSGSETDSYGGALTNLGGIVSLEHCTLYRSSSYTYPSIAVATIANLSGTVRLKNCILWDDEYPTNTPISGPSGSITVENSIIQGGQAGGMSSDPVLMAMGHPTSNSTACFGAGAGTFLNWDLEGQPRPASSPTLGAVQWTNTDGDSVPDWWEKLWFNHTLYSDSTITNPELPTRTLLQAYLANTWNPPPIVDRDGDGLHDAWELEYWGDLRAQDGTGDPDHDGVSNLAEMAAGTDPTRHPGDGDGDGLVDATELAVFGDLVQTGSGDFDHDGLSNFQEIWITGTDPKVADTNGDGRLDGFLNSFAATDSDGDGLSNAQEAVLGTDPFLADTDGDGVIDSLDAYPLNYLMQSAPQSNPLDTTPPVITLFEPLDAVLQP